MMNVMHRFIISIGAVSAYLLATTGSTIAQENWKEIEAETGIFTRVSTTTIQGKEVVFSAVKIDPSFTEFRIVHGLTDVETKNAIQITGELQEQTILAPSNSIEGIANRYISDSRVKMVVPFGYFEGPSDARISGFIRRGKEDLQDAFLAPNLDTFFCVHNEFSANLRERPEIQFPSIFRVLMDPEDAFGSAKAAEILDEERGQFDPDNLIKASFDQCADMYQIGPILIEPRNFEEKPERFARVASNLNSVFSRRISTNVMMLDFNGHIHFVKVGSAQLDDVARFLSSDAYHGEDACMFKREHANSCEVWAVVTSIFNDAAIAIRKEFAEFEFQGDRERETPAAVVISSRSNDIEKEASDKNETGSKIVE